MVGGEPCEAMPELCGVSASCPLRAPWDRGSTVAGESVFVHLLKPVDWGGEAGAS